MYHRPRLRQRWFYRAIKAGTGLRLRASGTGVQVIVLMKTARPDRDGVTGASAVMLGDAVFERYASRTGVPAAARRAACEAGTSSLVREVRCGKQYALGATERRMHAARPETAVPEIRYQVLL